MPEGIYTVGDINVSRTLKFHVQTRTDVAPDQSRELYEMEVLSDILSAALPAAVVLIFGFIATAQMGSEQARNVDVHLGKGIGLAYTISSNVSGSPYAVKV